MTFSKMQPRKTRNIRKRFRVFRVFCGCARTRVFLLMNTLVTITKPAGEGGKVHLIPIESFAKPDSYLPVR